MDVEIRQKGIQCSEKWILLVLNKHFYREDVAEGME